MSDEETAVAGRRRSRGAQATARADALERLKALRSGGRRSTDCSGNFQIKMEDRIYDTVDDDEYEALVAKRREEVKGFIVDDDGLGYGDEGQEEDWSHAGVTMSSEESEEESERSKRKKNNKTNLEKKEQQMTRKPSALTAAAALMGKQRISSMFTSSVFKKNKDDTKAKNLSCDSIVDDIIAEFAPDEADRERRRRRNHKLVSKSTSYIPINSNARTITGEKPVTSSVTVSAGHENNGLGDRNCEKDLPQQVSSARTSDSTTSEFSNKKDLPKESPNGKNSDRELEEDNIVDMSNCSSQENEKKFSNEVVEVKVEPVASMEDEKAFKLNAKIKEERDPALSAMAGWQAVRSAGNGTVSCSDSGEEKSEFELDSDGSLPFYILDAHEELFGANAGNLYLFGKVHSSFSFILSCFLLFRH